MQPSIPLSQVLPAAAFAHPQANRELRLGDAVVAYRLERARRRSIGFTVGPDGLAVRASWVTLGAVDAALRDKSDWILRKLHEAHERRQRLEHARIAPGTTAPCCPTWARRCKLVLDARHSARGVLHDVAVTSEPAAACGPSANCALV